MLDESENGERKILGKIFQRNFIDYVPTRVPCNNKKGYRVRYVYSGEIFSLDLGKRSYTRLKMAFTSLAVLLSALYLLILSRSVPSNRSYVMIPASLCLFAIGYVWMGVILLLTSSAQMRAWEYRSVNRRIMCGATLGMILFALAFFTDVVFLSTQTDAWSWWEALLCTGYALCAAMLSAYLVIWRNVTYQKQEADAEVKKIAMRYQESREDLFDLFQNKQ